MHFYARFLLLSYLGIWAISLLFMAVARPPLPPRLANYGLVIRVMGRWMYWWSAPVVRWFDARGLNANHVTFLGFSLTAFAGLLAAQGWWGLAGSALMFGSLCDIMDGELARLQNASRASGAFLDSSLDRLSEIALFGGMAAGFTDRTGAYWAYVAVGASMMVSYARARGEGLGVSCPPGGLERPHRVLIMMFTLLFIALFPERWAMLGAEVACAVVAVGATATAVSRLSTIYAMLRRKEEPAAAEPPVRPAPGPEKPASAR